MKSFSSMGKQHAEIMEMARYIKNLCAIALAAPDLKSGAGETAQIKLRNAVVLLMQKLKIHLLVEKDYFYPLLCRGKDPRAKMQSAQFIREQETLKTALEQFDVKWLESDTIRHAPGQFIQAVLQLIIMLEKQIAAENQELDIFAPAETARDAIALNQVL